MISLRINLLPYRERQRERRIRDFKALIGLSAVFGLGIALILAVTLKGQIDYQRGRNVFLQEKIDDLKKDIDLISSLRSDVEQLSARRKAVQSLQTDRNLSVYLLDDIARVTPEGTFFTNLTQQEASITLVGYAQSNDRVSELLYRLSNKSEWLTQPELVEVVATQLEDAFLPEKKNTPKSNEERPLAFRFGVKLVLKSLATSEAKDKNKGGPPLQGVK